MSLETYTGYIKDIVTTNPTSTDPKSQGDDHLRGIKNTLATQFSGFTVGTALTMTETELNNCIDRQPVLETSTVTTSGTSHSYTSIPTWANKVTLILNNVSTNGTSPLMVQLGDSGGVENTGHSGCVVHTGVSTGQSDTTTAGFQIQHSVNTDWQVTGAINFRRIESNIWVMDGHLVLNSSGALVMTSGGSKSLTGDLTTVLIRAVNGTDAFDGGRINLHYSQ